MAGHFDIDCNVCYNPQFQLRLLSKGRRCLHGGDYTKRLTVSSLNQAGGQGLTALHWRCRCTNRAERLTEAQCETESGAVSKSLSQICNSLEVGACMTCSIGCALFCSKRLCNYADNEVYCLVALKVLLGFKAGGVASQAISKVAQTCRYLCV